MGKPTMNNKPGGGSQLRRVRQGKPSSIDGFESQIAELRGQGKRWPEAVWADRLRNEDLAEFLLILRDNVYESESAPWCALGVAAARLRGEPEPRFVDA